jgi:hypothetical protein
MIYGDDEDPYGGSHLADVRRDAARSSLFEDAVSPA